MDGSKSLRQKSGGITLATGTGSTAWFYNISRIHPQTVDRLLSISKCITHHATSDVAATLPDPVPLCDPNSAPFMVSDTAMQITNTFNASIPFDPQDSKMAYVIREPVCNGKHHLLPVI